MSTAHTATLHLSGNNIKLVAIIDRASLPGTEADRPFVNRLPNPLIVNVNSNDTLGNINSGVGGAIHFILVFP
jgi:hypothetical protein